MKAKTNLIYCMCCKHFLKKELFKVFLSKKVVTARYCDTCESKRLPKKEFNKRVKERDKAKKGELGHFPKHENTKYSQKKRDNKKRLELLQELHKKDEFEL